MAHGGSKQRALGVGVVALVAGLVWVVVPSGATAPARSPSRPAPTTTTAPPEPVSVYGCPLTGPGGTGDQDCTDASVVAEYCGVPRESIATPGTDEVTALGTGRAYATAAGLPAGTIVRIVGGITLSCANKRTFTFTAADVAAFSEPA